MYRNLFPVAASILSLVILSSSFTTTTNYARPHKHSASTHRTHSWVEENERMNESPDKRFQETATIISTKEDSSSPQHKCVGFTQNTLHLSPRLMSSEVRSELIDRLLIYRFLFPADNWSLNNAVESRQPVCWICTQLARVDLCSWGRQALARKFTLRHVGRIS